MITPSQYLELVRRTQKPSASTTICGVEGGTEIENRLLSSTREHPFWASKSPSFSSRGAGPRLS